MLFRSVSTNYCGFKVRTIYTIEGKIYTYLNSYEVPEQYEQELRNFFKDHNYKVYWYKEDKNVNLKNFVDEEEGGNLPKEWKLENCGSDDGAGENSEEWKDSRRAIPKNCFGFAVDNGTGEYVFYSVDKKFRDEVIDYLDSIEAKWEHIKE